MGSGFGKPYTQTSKVLKIDVNPDDKPDVGSNSNVTSFVASKTGSLEASPHVVTPSESSPLNDVEVFVNGKAIVVPNNANLVEACRLAGVYVPTLCYHPRLQPIG